MEFGLAVWNKISLERVNAHNKCAAGRQRMY